MTTECVENQSKCPVCTSDVNCQAGYYCAVNAGLCYPFAQPDAICNDFIKCAPGHKCVYENEQHGLCKALNTRCPLLGDCTSCAVGGCIWDENIQSCSDECPAGRACFSEPQMCHNGCLTNADCSDGYCSSNQCRPYKVLYDICNEEYFACAPGLMCSFTSGRGVCERTGFCSDSTTCTHCTRRGCHFANGICGDVCPPGAFDCARTSAQCSTCQEDSHCSYGYCLRGECRNWLGLDQQCSEETKCAPGLACQQIGMVRVCRGASGTTSTCSSCRPGVEYCENNACVQYATNSQACNDRQCAPGLACLYGTCRLQGTCQTSTDCGGCVSRGCKWDQQSSTCVENCLLWQTCSTDLYQCSGGGGMISKGPLLTAAIQDPTYADPNVYVYLPFVSNFASPSGGLLTYSLVGLPRGTGLRFDANTAVLSGYPEAIDVNYQPLLTVTATDSSGYSVSSSFRLIFSRCERATSCESCAAQGCSWHGNKCSSFCPAGATCATSPSSCAAVSPAPTTCTFCCLHSHGLGHLCSSVISPDGTCCQSSERCCLKPGYTHPAPGAFQCCGGDSFCVKFNENSPEQCWSNTNSGSGGVIAPTNQELISLSVPTQYAKQNELFPFLDMSSYVYDPKGKRVTYSMSGTPAGSGIQLDPNSGMLFGVASEQDLNASPFVVQVQGLDLQGKRAIASVTFVVSPAASVGLPNGNDCPAYMQCSGYCRNSICYDYQTVGQICDSILICKPGLRCSRRPLGQGICEQSSCPLLTCDVPPAKCPPGSSLGAPVTSSGCAGCVSCLDTSGNAVSLPPCHSSPQQCAPAPICARGQVLRATPSNSNGHPPCCPTYWCEAASISECTVDSECAPNRYCRARVCEDRLDYGQTCNPNLSNPCVKGLACSAKGICDRPTQPIGCSYHSSCTACTASGCAWSGGRCSEYCLTGSPCFADSSRCPDDSKYLMCTNDSDCPSTHFCQPPSAQWPTTREGLGGEEQSVEEVPTRRQANMAYNYQCQPFRKEGDSCTPNVWRCEPHLECDQSQSQYAPVCRRPQAQGPVPIAGGTCCSGHTGKGCSVASVESCVCSLDPYCCSTKWDGMCGEKAATHCNACQNTNSPSTTVPSGNGVPPPPVQSKCCHKSSAPGCGNQAIEQCVCAIDNFCCNANWDEHCVAKVGVCGLKCDSSG